MSSRRDLQALIHGALLEARLSQREVARRLAKTRKIKPENARRALSRWRNEVGAGIDDRNAVALAHAFRPELELPDDYFVVERTSRASLDDIRAELREELRAEQQREIRELGDTLRREFREEIQRLRRAG